jgi:hypothetical protein
LQEAEPNFAGKRLAWYHERLWRLSNRSVGAWRNERGKSTALTPTPRLDDSLRTPQGHWPQQNRQSRSRVSTSSLAAETKKPSGNPDHRKAGGHRAANACKKPEGRINAVASTASRKARHEREGRSDGSEGFRLQAKARVSRGVAPVARLAGIFALPSSREGPAGFRADGSLCVEALGRECTVHVCFDDLWFLQQKSEESSPQKIASGRALQQAEKERTLAQLQQARPDCFFARAAPLLG